MTTSEWIYTIVLIVAIVLSLTLYAIALRKIVKEGFTGRWGSILVLAVGALFIVYLIYHTREIEPADWAQIMLMLGLVAVTGIYAFSTAKMASETREQRLSEARPYLLLRLKDEAVQWDKTEQGEQPAREFPITIRNVGKGPAINLWAALWGRRKSYFGDSKGYLAPDEEWETTVSRASTNAVELGIEKDSWLPELRQVIEREYPGVVTVKYNDIHQRVWVSYLCLERHVDVEYFVMEEEQNIVELNKNDKRSH